MRVLVIGASGLTGQLAVRRLLERGDEVTALVRDPQAFTQTHDRLKAAKGEARDSGSLARAMQGHDAVLSAFGPRTVKLDGIQEAFMGNLVGAMQRSGVKRLSNLSAWGTGDSYPQLWWGAKLIMRGPMGAFFADKERGEQLLFASGLDWVNVRPSRLSNGRARGGVKASLSAKDLKWFPLMTRDDTAAFMIEQLSAAQWLRQSPLIGY